MEEAEGPEAYGAGTDSTGTSGVDSVAVALALAGASREEADAFLSQQRILAQNQCSFVDIQKHHMHEQLKQLHLSVWEKRLGVLLRLATAIVGLAVAAGLAFMVWDAAHSNGLLIEPFSVRRSGGERPDRRGRGDEDFGPPDADAEPDLFAARAKILCQ